MLQRYNYFLYYIHYSKLICILHVEVTVNTNFNYLKRVKTRNDSFIGFDIQKIIISA